MISKKRNRRSEAEKEAGKAVSLEGTIPRRPSASHGTAIEDTWKADISCTAKDSEAHEDSQVGVLGGISGNSAHMFMHASWFALCPMTRDVEVSK